MVKIAHNFLNDIESFDSPVSILQIHSDYELMTETELIDFLRIPKISKARDFHNVVNHLKRFHDLPRIHICGQPLYPRKAIQEWIQQKTQG